MLSSGGCGSPVLSLNSSVEGLVVIYKCNPGLIPEGEFRSVCRDDTNKWDPDPGSLMCREPSTGRYTLVGFALTNSLRMPLGCFVALCVSLGCGCSLEVGFEVGVWLPSCNYIGLRRLMLIDKSIIIIDFSELLFIDQFNDQKWL